MIEYVLRKTVGSWSAGTRIELLDWPGSPSAFEMPEGVCEVRILAGDKPVIEVAEQDIVRRRKRERTVTGRVGGGTEGTTIKATENEETGKNV